MLFLRMFWSRPGATAARAALLDFTTRLGKLATQPGQNHRFFRKIRNRQGPWNVRYANDRNNPNAWKPGRTSGATLGLGIAEPYVQVFKVQALSGLSPWLHFGGLSRSYGLLGEGETCDGWLRSQLFMNSCI